MLEYIRFLNDYINVPAKMIAILIVFIIGMQIVGEIMELFGKAAPGIMKIRKRITARKQEETELRDFVKDATVALKEDKALFETINRRYGDDNIAKRDYWMKKVDDNIAKNSTDIRLVKDKLDEIYNISIKDHVEALRSVIIDFANRIADEKSSITQEEFRRVMHIHEEYEDFLKKHGLKNGQVDIAFSIITEDYARRLRNREFVEDMRDY